MAPRVTRMKTHRPRQGCSIDTVHAILEHLVSPIYNQSKAGTPVRLNLLPLFQMKSVIRDDDLETIRDNIKAYLKTRCFARDKTFFFNCLVDLLCEQLRFILHLSDRPPGRGGSVTSSIPS